MSDKYIDLSHPRKVRHTLLLSVAVFAAWSAFVLSPMSPRILRASVSAASTEAVVYVTQIGNESITAFTTPSHTPEGVIPTFRFSNGVGVSPDNRFFYLGKRGQVGLRVFDVATHAIVTDVSVSSNAIDFAFTRDSRFMYVMHDTTGATVEKIDLSTHSIVGQVTGFPTALLATNDSGVLSPDDQLLYVTFASITPSATESGVAIIETTTNTVVDFIPMVGFPSGIVMTPDGRFLYVNGRVSGGMWVIDTATRAVPATINVRPSTQSRIDITPDGRFVYVGVEAGFQQPDELDVIDTSTNTIVQTIVNFEGAQALWGVAVSPDGSLVYVVAQDRGKVFVLDQATNSVVTAVSVPGNPLEIAISPGQQDVEGPVTSNVEVDPNPVSITSSTVLMATLDDEATGGSNIAWAEYEIRDSANMLVDSGDSSGCPFGAGSICSDSFDSPTENVAARIEAGTFSSPGVYEACVRGTDANGNTGQFECILLVVYDSDGGFVTGGGWIQSQEAFCSFPSCVGGGDGKANFGFVSKYQQGATIPTGQTEFQFKAGDLNFHSTEYEWLVVAGPMGQFKGSGTINDTGDYGFLLTAKDSAVNGGPATDTFRIKIWDKASETIVYDNGTNQAVGGGSIVIHKK